MRKNVCWNHFSILIWLNVNHICCKIVNSNHTCIIWVYQCETVQFRRGMIMICFQLFCVCPKYGKLCRQRYHNLPRKSNSWTWPLYIYKTSFQNSNFHHNLVEPSYETFFFFNSKVLVRAFEIINFSYFVFRFITILV